MERHENLNIMEEEEEEGEEEEILFCQTNNT